MPRNMVWGFELKGFSPKVCWCCILGCQKSTRPTRNIGEPITVIVLVKSNLLKFYPCIQQETLMLSSLPSISLSSLVIWSCTLRNIVVTFQLHFLLIHRPSICVKVCFWRSYFFNLKESDDEKTLVIPEYYRWKIFFCVAFYFQFFL